MATRQVSAAEFEFYARQARDYERRQAGRKGKYSPREVAAALRGVPLLEADDEADDLDDDREPAEAPKADPGNLAKRLRDIVRATSGGHPFTMSDAETLREVIDHLERQAKPDAGDTDAAEAIRYLRGTPGATLLEKRRGKKRRR